MDELTHTLVARSLLSETFGNGTKTPVDLSDRELPVIDLRESGEYGERDARSGDGDPSLCNRTMAARVTKAQLLST
jgi:hypothetical protein